MSSYSAAADAPLTLAEVIPGGRTRTVALVVGFALLTALAAQITFHLPWTPVPITGQTFGVLLVGGALGFRRGLAAVLLYLLLGVVGLPFFAEGKGGFTVILGASGGYLIGFILAGALVGRLAELGWDRHLAGAVGAMVIGNALIYVVGLPWLAFVAHYDAATAVQKGFVPFIVGDALKLVLAAVVFPAAWWVVGRRPGER